MKRQKIRVLTKKGIKEYNAKCTDMIESNGDLYCVAQVGRWIYTVVARDGQGPIFGKFDRAE